MRFYEYIAIVAGLLTGVAFFPQLLKAICLGGKDSALSNLGLGLYALGLSLWIVWGGFLLNDTLHDEEPGYNGLVNIVFSSIGLILVLFTASFNIQTIRSRLWNKDSLDRFCQSKGIQKFLANF
jgi:uncharacterized protein with PQ loop repeat